MKGHEQNGGDHNVVIALGWSPAYSKDYTSAKGTARLDLVEGTLSVEVRDLEDPAILDVWLVDNVQGPGRSAMPEPGDDMIRVGTLEPDGNKATLRLHLGSSLDQFEVDQVVVARVGGSPDSTGVLFGAPGLFQRLYTRARLGRLEVPQASSEQPLLELGLRSVLAQNDGGFDPVFPTLDALVLQGADLFFNETFNENGRTCGTCHPAENNFTIDPRFIATLPDNDPLFVAEFVPPLRITSRSRS